MSVAETKFNADGSIHRSALNDHLSAAKTEYGGHTNFSAYRQGRDPQFLGVNGKNYYAKPWGNDSSNVQAVLNGPAYWKRIYYRENIAARFQREDEQAAAAAEAAEAAIASTGGGKVGMRKSQSEGSLQRLPKDAVDGYAQIKETMRPFVEKQGKPRIRKMQAGERLHFFNTLGDKYHMKAGGRNLAWNVSQETHRSSKSEMHWIVSNYFRTDTPAVLAGCGMGAKLESSPKS
uniref:Uncharacterized protein n=1 Tax=Alexandrium monilatum TaxID=311494 RepID=A0A7S4VPL8_9DINO|mmetsp:Transcript_81692/g.243573  ORF Transcript_81692/g.243573 Transcript_81692/m.243573 type:complete len:233 (-) Transcript_81692:34-732(-)